MSWLITGSQKVNWDPSRISTALWLDAADNTTVFSDAGTTQAVAGSSTVQQWNDKSGNGRHLLQATSGNRPSYSSALQNGRNAVTNTSGDFMQSQTTGLLRNVSGATFAIVGRLPSESYNNNNPVFFGILRGDNNSSVRYIFNVNEGGTGTGSDSLSISGRRLDSDGFTSLVSSRTRTSVLNSFFTHITTINYSNATASMFFNGTQDLANSSFLTAGNTQDTDSLGAVIFALSTGTNAIPDQTSLAEVVVCHQVLSAIDRQKLEGYLAHKWGLTTNLPSNHPYKVNPPAP